MQSFTHKPPDGPGSTLYAELVSAAVNAARGGGDPVVTGEEGLHVLKSIFALCTAQPKSDRLKSQVRPGGSFLHRGLLNYGRA